MPSSDIVRYADVSPDIQIPGCMNTGEEGDGIILLGVDEDFLLGRSHAFIGRTTVNEAFAELHGITVNEVTRLLKVKDENADLKAAVKDLTKKLAEFEAFKQKAEDAGVIITAL